MAQGLVVLSGENATTGSSGFGLWLENGTFVVTPGGAPYSSPWMVFQAVPGPGGSTFSMVSNRAAVAGHATSGYGEIVFECDSDTISGTFFRTDASVDATLLIPPERMVIPAGQTELLFSITFLPVNDIGDIERPDWVESARSQ